MKNKTKTSKKVKTPVLSRVTLKTYIVIAALTVFISGLMTVKFYYDALQMGDSFRFALYTLYPLVTVVGPLLAFGIVYAISKERTTKLWRVSKAAMIATIAAMFQSFVTPISMSVFAQSAGYGDTPPATPSVLPVYLFELTPVILALAVAVVLSVVLSKSKTSNVSDATPMMQKMFLAGVVVFGLGQSVVSAAMQIGDPMSQSIEVLAFDMLTSLIVPLIILCALFLVVSRQRGIFERSFVAVFYAVIGVMLLVALSPVPYLFSNPMQQSFYAGWLVMYLPSITALVAFVSIVCWHKLKKAM